MKRFQTLIIFLNFSLIIPHSEGAIELLYGIKEQRFEQFGNSQPSMPIEWTIGAGVSGDSELTSLTIELPGGLDPVPVEGEPGGFGFEARGFTSQAELDAAYPNGNITFNVTDQGTLQQFGPYSISGDTYPIIPYITNAIELQDSDYSQDFEIAWNEFVGSQEGDQILLQVFDNEDDSDVLFQLLDATATSFIIPGGTFLADKNYEIALVFISKTDASEISGTIIGYLSSTSHTLSTHSSDTRLLLYKWRGQQQTGPETFADPNYRMLATVTGVSRTIDGALLAIPGSGIATSMNPFGPNVYGLITPFGSKETLDSSYPEGEYSFIVTEDAIDTAYGPHYLPGDDYPDTPRILNFEELQNFDFSQDQPINWNQTPIGVSFIQTIVLDEVNSTVWEASFGPGSTSTVLPANTLTSGTSYRLIMRFWAPKATNNKPPTALGYLSSSSIPLNSSTGGGDPSFEFSYILKGKNFVQEGNIAPQSPRQWRMNAGVSGSSNVTSALFIHPNGSEMLTESDGEFELDDREYQSIEELDTAFPDGQYDLQLSSGGGSQPLGPFQITGSAYPEIPHLQNVMELANHNFSDSYELTWAPFSSADLDDKILLEVYDDSTNEIILFEFLDPGSTSYVIPGNSLAPDRYYEFNLIFLNRVDALETPELLVGYISGTEIRLSTHTSDSSIRFYKTQLFEQTGQGELEDRGYRPLTIIRGNSNTVSFVDMLTPVTIFPINMTSPNNFVLTTGYGAKEIMDIDYPSGDYIFALTENEKYFEYGPYELPPDAYPQPALIQEYSEIQDYDSTQDRTVTWGEVPGDVTGIGVQIRDQSFRLVWAQGFPTDATSAVIPAGSLSKLTNYNLSVQFWAEKSGSEKPQTIVGYGTASRVFFQTAPYSSAYASWLVQFFSDVQIQDLGIVGENVDFDGDKSSNYYEFLTNTDPTDPHSNMELNPEFGVDEILKIGPLSTGLMWELHASTNLIDWNKVGVELYSVVDDEIQLDLNSFLPDTLFRIEFKESTP